MDKIFNIINCCGKRDEIFINSDINIQTNNLIDNSVIEKKTEEKEKEKSINTKNISLNSQIKENNNIINEIKNSIEHKSEEHKTEENKKEKINK